MNQDALTLVGLGTPAVELTVEAKEARDGLIREANKVSTVADQIDADSAAALLRDMQTFLRMIEAGRKSVKQPVLDVGRQIDATAKELVQTVAAESDRISRLLGSYQAEQRRLAEERVREERRKLEEQAREERRRIEEEARRQAARIRAAEDDQSRADAQAEAEKALAEQQARSQTALAERQAALNEVTPPKIDGTQVRVQWCFELVDIDALYKAAPHLCNIEPNGTAIRAVIKTNHSIPGLRIWKEEKTIISKR